MGRATTRPRDGLKACRAHVLILPVRTTRLTPGRRVRNTRPGERAIRHRRASSVLYLSVAGPGGLVESRPELHTELVMATRGCS